LLRDAGDVACQELQRRITGKRPSDAYFKAVTRLGQIIAEQDGWKAFCPIPDYKPEDVMMPYKNE
jgi:hypothetical protein